MAGTYMAYATSPNSDGSLGGGFTAEDACEDAISALSDIAKLDGEYDIQVQEMTTREVYYFIEKKNTSGRQILEKAAELDPEELNPSEWENNWMKIAEEFLSNE